MSIYSCVCDNVIRLRSTAALRSLEAVARLASYTRAAEELHVTQSAISHQIRHIEGLWGIKLFRRRGRRLAETPEAQAVVPIVREFLERLESALHAIASEEERGSLRVSLLQSFAFKWLVPRLERVQDCDGEELLLSTLSPPSLVGTAARWLLSTTTAPLA